MTVDDEEMNVVSDDEILALADAIRERRAIKYACAALLEQEHVTLRWAVPHYASKFPHKPSYASLEVPTYRVQGLITDYKDRIKW